MFASADNLAEDLLTALAEPDDLGHTGLQLHFPWVVPTVDVS